MLGDFLKEFIKMIRIGLSRWNTIFENIPSNNGMVRMSLKLTPQAESYKVLYKEWYGLHDSENTKIVQTKSFEANFYFERYQKISHTVEQLKKAALTLSSDAVRFCINNDIVDNKNCEVKAVIYLVNYTLMRLIENNTSDKDEKLTKEVDLVTDMRAMKEERERRIREEEQRVRNLYTQHQEEEKIRSDYLKKNGEEAKKKSFEFLEKFLSKNEKEMWETHKCIKISNCVGDFFIHPCNHSMVDQFINGKFIQSHCIVFKDYTLPIGDEVAMKVALLKTDINRFLSISNKFNYEKKRMPF